MTNEMKQAMEHGKIKMVSVSSKIEVYMPANKEIIDNQATKIKELFENNLNGAVVNTDGLTYSIVSHNDENAAIRNILDDVVALCFEAKEKGYGAVLLVVNGTKTEF